MRLPLFRFRLTHQYPEGAVEFTNNEFQVSITGWDQFVFSGTQSFGWDGGTARADGSVSNLPSTAAIGQIGPAVTGNRWHPGTYIIDIVAKNNSAGGSAPLQSLLNIYASNSTASIQQSVTYTGVGTWDVVPVSDGYTTRRITFELTDYWNYIFFSFSKVGSTTGYEVDLRIESINVVTIPISQLISEPHGWENAVLKLERHKDFHSLVEYFEGTSFIFYGSDGVKDGGINFIKTAEYQYGQDVKINIDIDVSYNDGGSYDDVFIGQLDLSGLQELSNNKMEVPIIRNDLWAKFIARKDTPVDLRATTDLDGGTVPVIDLVDIDLTSQVLRLTYDAHLDKTAGFPGLSGITIDDNVNEYVQFDWNIETLNEIEEKFSPSVASNPERPVNIFKVKYGGTYNIECVIDIRHDDVVVVEPATYLDIFLLISPEGTPIAFNETAVAHGFGNAITRFSYSGSHTLYEGDEIFIYGFRSDLTTDFKVQYQHLQASPPEEIQFLNYLTITADTIFPSTASQAYLIHDAFAAVIDRIIGKPNSFYSEYLGGLSTNARQYDLNGCAWNYIIAKGLHIRGFTVDDKKFFASFKDLWNGLNPILNLGLCYDTINGEEVIRIEQKSFFYDSTDVSIYLDNAYLTREYDNSVIFKKITIGYNKWQSENISGLDDPQTKHVYAIPFTHSGIDTEIMSEFIAAGLAIETTRRQQIKQSKDYKFDNDIFIIALNTDDVSPDRYRPELTENFNSVTGLLNSSTRYNLILTPKRNLLRWANFFGGCLQKNTVNLPYKFVSGEGNYDMVSDYACSGNLQCIAIICDSIAENADLNLADASNYNSVIGHLYKPELYTIEKIDLAWEQYKTIRDNRHKAIAISQTNSNHKKFFIKESDYKICQANATVIVRDYDDFSLSIPESIQPMDPCGLIEAVSNPFDGFDEDYIAILNYAISQGFTLPSSGQQVLQNQLVLDLKAEDVWSRLDLLYIFATAGDSDFARINWKNPGTFNCTEINSPTHTTNIGYAGNGSTSYLTTGWDPATNAIKFTLDDGGVFCYINNDAASANVAAFGCRGNGGGSLNGQTLLFPDNAVNSHSFAANSAANDRGSTVVANGFYHIERDASTTQRLFKNGSQVGTDASTSTNSLCIQDMYIGAANTNGSTSFYSTYEIGFFGIGESMSTLDHSGFYNAWNTYFTSL